MISTAAHRPGSSQEDWSNMAKSQKDPGQGALYQWLTTGSLRQATCVQVYPGGRLSRSSTSTKFCIWTEHSVCISKVQISAFFFPSNRTKYNLFKLFHLWMDFTVMLPWHVLPSSSHFPPILFQPVEFGRKLSVLLQFLGSCYVPLSHWSIDKAEFTWQTGLDLSKSR